MTGNDRGARRASALSSVASVAIGTALAIGMLPLPTITTPAQAQSTASRPLTSTLGTITEYPVTLGSPYDITVGPDSNLWFTEQSSCGVGNMSTDGTVVGEYSTTCGRRGRQLPQGITTGPDGAMWWASGVGGVYRSTDTSAVPTNFACGTDDIAQGHDSNLWTVNGAGISQLITDGTCNGQAPLTAAAAHITSGPDGALWFTEPSSDLIGRLTTKGVLTEYAVSSGSGPTYITTGPDGALWFSETDANRIGRMTTHGTLTNEFPISTANSQPHGITTGPDGKLWFTESSANNIARMSVDGTITEYAVPSAASEPEDIVTGPDKAMWFTEYGSGKIGRISHWSKSTVTVTASPNPASPGQRITFTATLTPSDPPSGTVTFRDGATTLCIATIAGTTARCTSEPLSEGTHHISAVYAGDGAFLGSNSPIMVETVAPVAVPVPATGGRARPEQALAPLS